MHETVQGIEVRAGNIYDQNIVLAVLRENEYKLPEKFEPNDVIIDIGAHVGSFSYACLTRRAGLVYAFEPDEQNFELCRTNLEPFGQRIHIFQKAVWRSDVAKVELKYTGYSKGPYGVNCGGGNVVFNDGLQISVQAEALDSILANLNHVRLMKLDCESSEWPILFTSRLLNRVDEIVGEYHEIGGKYNTACIPTIAQVPGFASYTVDKLVEFLNLHNFRVETTRPSDSNIGLFFAKRF